jgi:hypothetical protein
MAGNGKVFESSPFVTASVNPTQHDDRSEQSGQLSSVEPARSARLEMKKSYSTPDLAASTSMERPVDDVPRASAGML